MKNQLRGRRMHHRPFKRLFAAFLAALLHVPYTSVAQEDQSNHPAAASSSAAGSASQESLIDHLDLVATLSVRDAWLVTDPADLEGFRNLLNARANARRFVSEFGRVKSHWKLYGYEPSELSDKCDDWMSEKPESYDYPIGVVALVFRLGDQQQVGTDGMVTDGDNSRIAIPLKENWAPKFSYAPGMLDLPADQADIAGLSSGQEGRLQSIPAYIASLGIGNWIVERDESRSGEVMGGEHPLGVEFICERFGEQAEWSDNVYVATGTPLYDWTVAERFVPIGKYDSVPNR